MTTLANNANITLTLGDFDSVTITTQGLAIVTAVSGLGVTAGKLGELTGSRTFGPYAAGQLNIAASVTACQYEVADGVRPAEGGGGGGTALVPASKTTLGGVIVGNGLTVDAAGVLDSDAVVPTGQVPLYLGLVATKGKSPSGRNPSITTSMSKVVVEFKDSPASFMIDFPNFYVDGFGSGGSVTLTEMGVGATGTVRASVEYPTGVFTRVNFSGAGSGSIPDMSILRSDPIPVKVAVGDKVAIWIYYTNPSGIVYTANVYNAPGDNYAAPGTDLTAAGGTLGQAAQALYAPYAIVGMTTRRSGVIIGDSIGLGQLDFPDAIAGDAGCFSRAVAERMAYSKFATGSDTLVKFLAYSTLRRQILNNITDVYCNLVTNDFGGRTNAQIVSDLNAIIDFYPNKKFWIGLPAPRSGSTDFYSTVAGQTTDSATEPKRQAFMSSVRKGKFPKAAGYISMECLETSEFSGIWKTENNGRVASDIYMTAGTNQMGSSTAVYTQHDNGKAVRVNGVGAGGSFLTGYLSYNVSNQAYLVNRDGSPINAVTTVSGTGVLYLGAFRLTIDGLHHTAEAAMMIKNSGCMSHALPA